jgi:hypothetical protein
MMLITNQIGWAKLKFRNGPIIVAETKKPMAPIEKGLPGPGLLAQVAVIRNNLDAGVDTYVNVNNHYEGSAPLTVRRLLEILRTD